MKTILIYRMDSPNVGDNACCPADYFDIPGERRDIEAPPERADLLIFGGGGLLYNEKAIQGWLARSPKAKVIGWGLGLNGQCVVPAWMDRFDLLGMRDWRPAFDTHKPPIWAPCASCMSPLLDGAEDTAPPHQWVVYWHHDRPIDLSRPLLNGATNIDLPLTTPQGENFGGTMASAVAFLRSGRNVATNSFHGWYWAMLMGRWVCLTEKWRTSFMNRPYPDGRYIYPSALESHRRATLEFWERVCAYLDRASR